MRPLSLARLGLLIVLALEPGCQSEQASQETAPTPVRTVRAIPRTTETNVRYSASVEPDKQVEVAFKVSGYLRAILQVLGADGKMRDVGEGDVVQKDTVLAQVNDTDYRENVAKAKANLAKANAQLAKAKDEFNISAALFKTRSTTRPKYDQKKKDYEVAVAEVSAAKAQLVEAELDLEYCQLKAPMAGVVVSRAVEVGSLVRPDTVGFTLADTQDVKVVFSVPDTMLANVRLGLPLDIATESIPDETFQGTVTAISPAANSQSRVFNVEIKVANPDQRLKIGMVASVALEKQKDSAPAVMVPMSAIVRPPGDSDGYALFVVEEKDGSSIASLRRVELGEVQGDSIAAIRGVDAGDRVITMGATFAKNGERVRVIP